MNTIVKKLIPVMLVLMFLFILPSCTPSKRNVGGLTMGSDLNQSPLTSLSWGIPVEEIAESLHLTDQDLIPLSDPYDWMRDGFDVNNYELPEGQTADSFLLKNPTDVLGIPAKQVVFRVMNTSGLIGKPSSDLFLYEIYVWFPYENESSLSQLKDTIQQSYGESSAVRINPDLIQSGAPKTAPVDDSQESLWYSSQSLYDTLSPEASSYYQQVLSKTQPMWNNQEAWDARLKSCFLTSINLSFSEDQFYNVGEGGYSKQDPPLIELNFNGGYACISKTLQSLYPSEG